MTDLKHHHKILDTHTTEVRVNNKIESQLEQKLIYLIKYIKTKMDALMDTLVHTGEEGEFAVLIVNLVHVVESIQTHFEFNLALLSTKSKEEVEELKKKFTSITKLYDVLNTKEDLLQAPFIIILDFFRNTLCAQIENITGRCFKKHVNGDTLLLETEENVAKIKIITNKLEILSEFFPKVYHFHKDEVICHDRSSPIWQDIYSCTTYKANLTLSLVLTFFKEFLTKDEVTSSFKQFHQFMQISHAIIKSQIKGKPSPGLWSTMSLLKDIVYYSNQAAKAETQALLYLTKPTADYAFQAWKLTDHPMISKIISFRFPKIVYDEMIYIPRLFPSITKALIFKEYANKTINKVTPMDHSYLTGHRVPKLVAEDIAELLVERPNKIPIRILALENLHINNPSLRKHDSKVHQEEAIVIHIHGGGFVAMSSSSHRVYLNQWANDLKMIHFSVDYRLAPENPYPAALDDVWQAYLWIINYASTVLGIKYKKVILAGESAGGNLILALTLRILKAGLQPPHGVYSIYPALWLSDSYCNPSHLKAINDPVLNFNILRLCLTSYVPGDCETRTDPFISPVLVSDELLTNFPPTRFIVGSEDPLVDDSFRFVGKLRRNKRDVKMVVHNHLSHGFMSHQDMKYYDRFLKEGSDTIQELVDIKSHTTISH